MDEESDPVGEAVCWLDLLCPECGAMPEDPGSQDPDRPCWRCGAVPGPEAGDGAADPGRA